MSIETQTQQVLPSASARRIVPKPRGASLNIKNPQTVQLIHDLAALKGVSLTTAVTDSVRETLEREAAEIERRNSRKGMGDRIRAIVRKTAPLMRDTLDSTQIFDDLYDEMGLP